MTTPKTKPKPPAPLKMQNSNYAATKADKETKLKRFNRLVIDGGMSHEAASKRVGSNRQTLRNWAIELGLKWPEKKK
jgi:hypothetical protein